MLETFEESEEDYYTIMKTGGRFAEHIEDLDATLLHVPHELLKVKGQKNEHGTQTWAMSVAVMRPDMTSAKQWQHEKAQQFREQYPDEIAENDGAIPKKKLMPPIMQEDYQKIVDEYQDRLMVIGLGAARDVYGNKWDYEGVPSSTEQEKLAAAGTYHGPITDARDGRLVRFLRKDSEEDIPISWLIGKYGEGLWPYRDGLGRDFIQEQGNPEHELWEYGNFAPAGRSSPREFYYVPVVPEKPHQLYITCGWNGNIDYLRNYACKGESLYDNTIRYTFSLRRKDLVNYKELNQQAREVIESLIVKKGPLSEVRQINEGKND